MRTETVRDGRLGEDLPQNIVGVPVAIQSKSDDVAAYLVLEFVQAFEGSPVQLSWRMNPELTAMNRKVARNKAEKDLFV
jgi:hypothetical protein